MKKFILYLIFICASFVSFAQAFEDKIEYAKKSQPCIVMNYSYPPEAVENAIISKMNKLGYKGKEEKGLFNKDKGFRVYKETYIQEISSSRYDYILKVERKSRKESDETVVCEETDSEIGMYLTSSQHNRQLSPNFHIFIAIQCYLPKFSEGCFA